VGAHYEVTGSTVTKYYFAGAQRIALRAGGTLNYLLGDHLGSTSLTTSATGTVISELRYKAWGEVRYTSGTTPTKYTYTAQYSYASDFGLLFYNTRWYDPSLGRFNQPDPIVPQSQGIQALDRFTYTNNNPLRYTDPTGHRACDDFDSAGRCITAPGGGVTDSRLNKFWRLCGWRRLPDLPSRAFQSHQDSIRCIMTAVTEILKSLEELIHMTNVLLAERPSDARLKVMLLNLEEARREFSKPELNKDNIGHLGYAITRVFEDMLEFEDTPFGEAIGKLLIELNQY